MKAKIGFGLMVVAAATVLYGQGPGGMRRPGPHGPPGGGGLGPDGRIHTENRQKSLKLVRATRTPRRVPKVSISQDSEAVRIKSNGIPKHKIGSFPNKHNPNKITEQSYDIVIPGDPKQADKITFIDPLPKQLGQRGGPPMVFGITFDGVLMDPGTAELWMGDRSKGWNYEALGGAVSLGLDSNFAHVQPDGNYHYHGIPTGLMNRLGFKENQHSPMIGWAADGFPIYAINGFAEAKDDTSGIGELKSSYRLKKGSRPRGKDGPGGKYDGAFVQDYEFVSGSGDLDECNGRFCITPEFPQGTYAYFLTKEWPVIPRAFRGTPVVLKAPPAHPGGGGKPPRN